MEIMKIPDEMIELLEAHLDPKETAKAIHAIGELLSDIDGRSRERELRFVEELKGWLSTELATKSELVALEGRLREEMAALESRLRGEIIGLKDDLREEMTGLEGRLKEELHGFKERMAKVEGRLEATATKEDLAKFDKKFTVYFIVLLFTVIFLNQNALEFIAHLMGWVK
ncbi:MAG: hypothetical protein JXR29_05755 [Methylothermaceae bacterium]|nr:hypothetical protein [Methylothermaceae bacterium]